MAVLFLGDCITAGWRCAQEIWDKSFGACKMPDFPHLSTAGYQNWADAITPKLAEWTK